MRAFTFHRCLVCILCAVLFFSSFSYAAVSPADEQKLQEAAALLEQRRENRTRVVQMLPLKEHTRASRLRRNELIVARKCLNKVREDAGREKLPKEVIDDRVERCLSHYQTKRRITGAVAVGGFLTALAAHALLYSDAYFTYMVMEWTSPMTAVYLRLGGMVTGAVGAVAWLSLRPLPAGGARIPGGYAFYAQLKANPDLFADSAMEARQLLSSPAYNADGALNRYLDNYIYYLRALAEAEFVLSLPDIESEYAAWAELNGVSPQRPDMMKYLEIAAKYPLSAQELSLREAQRARTLRAVQNAVKESVMHPASGV